MTKDEAILKKAYLGDAALAIYRGEKIPKIEYDGHVLSKNGYHYLENWHPTLSEILKTYPNVLMDLTPEERKKAAKSDIRLTFEREDLTEEEILDAVEYGIPQDILKTLSDRFIIDLVMCSFDVFYQIPEERWTIPMAEDLAKRLADKGEYIDRITRIPERVRTKTFWKYLCIADGYYYSICPYKEIFTEEIIHTTLENAQSYVSTYWLYESIPDELKTEEISLKCCRKHFGCIEYLPKELKNDAFYEKILASGQENLLSEVDLNTISKEVVKKCTYFPNRKLPARLWDEEVAEKVANLSLIPKKYQTEKVIKACIRKNGTQIQYVKDPDEDLCVMAMESSPFCALKYIPEQKDSFWEKVIEKRAFYKISDLPEKYREKAWSPDKCKFIEDIPDQSEEKILAWIDSLDMVCPSDFTKVQSKKIYRAVRSKCKNLLWCMQCFDPEYWDKEDLAKVLDTEPKAIFLKGLAKEDYDRSVQAFPENILYVPEEMPFRMDASGQLLFF